MKYEPEPGESIYLATQKAISLAKREGLETEFTFNGINLRVSQFSFDIDICEIYHLKCKICRLQR
jgi:hypothetical protein